VTVTDTTESLAKRFTPHPPEVKERAKQLYGEGRSKAEIGRELGVTQPTLRRWLQSDAPPPPAADATLDADAAADAIVRQITSARGGKKRARKSDPPPRAAGAPPASAGTSTPSDAELFKAMSAVLCFPAVPMQMAVGCDFCAAHFASSGGPAAAELIRLSHTSPGLRTVLNRVYGLYEVLMTGGILALYAGKPLLHHLAPAPVLALAGPLIGVPPRQGMHNHPGVVATPMPAAQPDPAPAARPPDPMPALDLAALRAIVEAAEQPAATVPADETIGCPVCGTRFSSSLDPAFAVHLAGHASDPAAADPRLANPAAAGA
jgi:transposase-like protein